MAFPKNTIKLGAARDIFQGVKIEELIIGGKVAGYRAKWRNTTIENTGLTALTAQLWALAST